MLRPSRTRENVTFFERSTTRSPRPRRSPRSPRARAAAPSSGGRDRAASTRPCLPEDANRLLATPSMSATPVQLMSVSRPRDGQARFGQRCIASPSGSTIAAPHSGQGRHPELLRTAPVRPGRADDLRMTSPARWTKRRPRADALAVDVLLVVKRRPRHGDAADLHRLDDRPRIERARPADADADLEQPRHRGHRRPLVRARPARPLVERRRAGAADRASRP